VSDAPPAWPFAPPRTPMEARVRTTIPTGGDWVYEPKWDGFRALAWPGHDGAEPRLDSRNQRPLLRYFPELRPAFAELPPGTVVDGEVVVVLDGASDFDALQQRVHPAQSRIDKLAAETPAALVAFDLLAADGEDLRDAPFSQRRERLEALVGALGELWHLTPSTRDAETASEWFTAFESAGCDGLVGKHADGPYVHGQRAMAKIKHRRTSDCVVGGYRIHKDGDAIGSLLLGLYNGDELAFIGHCSGFSDEERRRLLSALRPYETTDSFGETVRHPGEPSRWSGGKDLSFVALRPELVCEVSYDQLTGDRFRHATRMERWRPDKDPAECTIEQLERPDGPGFADIVGG